MKKLFTLAATILASFSLTWAGVNVFTERAQVINDGDWIITGPDNDASSQSSVIFPDTEMEPGFPTGKQTAANYFKMNGTSDLGAKLTTAKRSTIKNLAEGDVITVYWFATNTTKSTFTLSYAHTAGKGTKLYESEGITPVAKTVYASELPALAAEDITKIANSYDGTDGLGYISCNNSVYVYAIKIEGSVKKTIVSTTEELINAKVNGVTLDPNFLSELINTKSVEVLNAYTTAPTVTFTKHVVITYDDESTEESDVDVEVLAEALGSNQWTANITLNGADTYSITMQRAAAYTVTYMYGKNVLGTEVVAAGAEPTEYVQYQTMPLATFEGWYRDEDLTTALSLPMAITQDFTFYAKFTMAYLNKNVNIEQLVLDNGTKYDIRSALTAAGWAYENLDVLDSLNDAKTARNEPYLGLKMKTKGAYIQGNLKVDGILLVKFGNIGCDINVTIKGAESNVDATFKKEDLWNEDDQAYVLAAFGFPDDVLITITTTDKGTVVLKQLMLDEIAEVTLPDSPATAIENTEAAVKAVKVVENGQLFIIKNGVKYSAQGAVVR